MTDAYVAVTGSDSTTSYVDNREAANTAAPGGTAKRQVVAAMPVGTFGYAAGTSGTETLSGSKRVQSLAAHAPTSGAASVTINGGDSITVPAGTQLALAFGDGVLVDPEVVFTGTDSYYLDWLA